MNVKITYGAGRFGKSWRVQLLGAHGYTLHSFVTHKDATLMEATESARHEYGALVDSATVNGKPKG